MSAFFVVMSSLLVIYDIVQKISHCEIIRYKFEELRLYYHCMKAMPFTQGEKSMMIVVKYI